jgi:Uma2 family endonuclease
MIATFPLPPKVSARSTRLFDRDEYWQMAKLGFFTEQRVELLDGEILVMSPQNENHCSGIRLLALVLDEVFGPGYWPRVQMPLNLSVYCQPEPDVAVVQLNPRTPNRTAPTTALLVVEISDSTLRQDQRFKANMYAAHGILDYWIVNLVDRQLEVRRDPIADASEPFGHRYATLTILTLGQSIAPLALPTGTVAVADLLPN